MVGMVGCQDRNRRVQVRERRPQTRDLLFSLAGLLGDFNALGAEGGYGMVGHAAKVGRRPSDFLGRCAIIPDKTLNEFPETGNFRL